MTWSFSSAVAAGATQTVTVTVIYPSPTFTPGQLVTNTATAIGHRQRDAGHHRSVQRDQPLQPNSPAATVKKTDTKATVAIGNSDTYTITATNTATSPSRHRSWSPI